MQYKARKGAAAPGMRRCDAGLAMAGSARLDWPPALRRDSLRNTSPRMRGARDQAGFTLLEILVVVAILDVVQPAHLRSRGSLQNQFKKELHPRCRATVTKHSNVSISPSGIAMLETCLLHASLLKSQSICIRHPKELNYYSL